MARNDWTADIPVYVTRENASGVIGTISMGAWAVVTVLILLQLNLIGWGIYGLVQLGGHVF